MEDSTRTGESFRNAVEFHRVKLAMFDSESSSFNKSESYVDGFMIPVGYHNRIFVVRIFESLAEYLAQPDTARRFYFTRPQLERMGFLLLDH